MGLFESDLFVVLVQKSSTHRLVLSLQSASLIGSQESVIETKSVEGPDANNAFRGRTNVPLKE